MRRRAFLSRAASAAALVLAGDAGAQEQAAPGAAPAGTSRDPQESGSNLFPMDQAAARSVRRPPKPDARVQVDRDERDALERDLRCQCGCTLDVYTCRTTDFACQVSPAMHRDVISLVEGGYDATEIVAAFVDTYGERVLMAPTRSGFNLLGWLMPFTALLAGAAVVAVLVRRWSRRASAVRGAEGAGPAVRGAVDASPDELAALDAEVRGDR